MTGRASPGALALVLLLALLPSSARGEVLEVKVLYTGAIRGELEPCGCSPATQSGGLARLSAAVSSIRAGDNAVIVLDAGDSLAPDTPQGRLKSEAVLRSFSAIGYDAAAFQNGLPEGLKGLLSDKAALSNAGGASRSNIIERGGLKANVSVFRNGSKKGMLNVLLTDEHSARIGPVDGWDVVVTSSGETFEGPLRIGGSVIVSGWPKGQRLGVLTLRLDKNGRVLGSTHEWRSLGKEIGEDLSVRKILADYDAKVAELAKAEAARPSEKGPYTGASSCVECHGPFYESWKTTRHASAFASLEKAGKSLDPECVVCHSIGYGKAGGFVSSSSTPNLSNVQCEACHGPGREHLSDISKPLGPVKMDVCLKCHTPINSPEFDYEGYRKKILH